MHRSVNRRTARHIHELPDFLLRCITPLHPSPKLGTYNARFFEKSSTHKVCRVHKGLAVTTNFELVSHASDDRYCPFRRSGRRPNVKRLRRCRNKGGDCRMTQLRAASYTHACASDRFSFGDHASPHREAQWCVSEQFLEGPHQPAAL